jgi:CRP-like cAMP-binding protein
MPQEIAVPVSTGRSTPRLLRRPIRLLAPPPRPISLIRLSSLTALTASEEVLVSSLEVTTLSAGRQLFGVCPNRLEPNSKIPDQQEGYLLLSGWAARVADALDPRTSIVNLILPGDPISILPNSWAAARLPVFALTTVIVARAGPLQEAIASVTAEQSGLRRALELACWRDQAASIGTIIRLSRLDGQARIAHLFLELQTRLSEVGLLTSRGFRLPVSQDIIAGSLGLSLVHFSRTLRQMRQDGLLSLENGYARLLQPDRLTLMAGAGCGGL